MIVFDRHFGRKEGEKAGAVIDFCETPAWEAWNGRRFLEGRRWMKPQRSQSLSTSCSSSGDGSKGESFCVLWQYKSGSVITETEVDGSAERQREEILVIKLLAHIKGVGGYWAPKEAANHPSLVLVPWVSPAPLLREVVSHLFLFLVLKHRKRGESLKKE